MTERWFEASPSWSRRGLRGCELGVAEILPYARIRMEQRDITDADVNSALELETQPPRPSNRIGRMIRRGFDAEGRLLDVVLNEHGEVVNTFRP